MRPGGGGFGRGFRWTATAALMAVLVAVFAFQQIDAVYFHTYILDRFALTPAALESGYVWQFFTFQFLHASLMHLLGNLLALWFFGNFVEQVMGPKRFLLAYFGSGAAGGLLQCVLMVLFPRHFGMLVVGASAGAMGIFAIFARLQSNATILMSFVLPIRADVLLWITAAVSLFFTLVPSGGGGMAHAAHLGGLATGLLWVRMGWQNDDVPLPWENWMRGWRRARSGAAARRRRPESGDSAGWPGVPEDELAETGREEFISREVDPILDKISKHGIQSLTERERNILERARNRMAKR
ncbi:MAG: rhomboid family intramembrane serine protease [Verrucomicrobiota bacterium]